MPVPGKRVERNALCFQNVEAGFLKHFTKLRGLDERSGLRARKGVEMPKLDDFGWPRSSGWLRALGISLAGILPSRGFAVGDLAVGGCIYAFLAGHEEDGEECRYDALNDS